MAFKKGDQVTTSDGAWWDGEAIVKTMYTHQVKLEGYAHSLPLDQVRAGHSKSWEEVQSKFGAAWYQ